MSEALDTCADWLFASSHNHRVDKNRFLNKLNEINIFPKNPKVILVAGTNGKGTTSYLLESILQAAGYRTGTFISPHLMSIHERVRILGQTVGTNVFLSAFQDVKALYQDEAINWFEFLSVVGLLIFAQYSLDVLIIEIGIGGREDILNTLDPLISIVTTIALDHCEHLGYTREAIGSHKAAIYRPGRLAICGDPNVPATVLEYANDINAQLKVQGQDFSYQLTSQGWDWSLGTNHFTGLPIPHMPIQNASTALAALCAEPYFQISETAIRQGLISVSIPGRLMPLINLPQCWVDVAHNPEASAYLAQSLAKKPVSGKTYAIAGMKLNKDIANSIMPMLPLVDGWFLVDFPEQGFVEQAGAVISESISNVMISQHKSLSEAYEKVAAIVTKNDRIIAFGSFLVVAEMMRINEYNSKRVF